MTKETDKPYIKAHGNSGVFAHGKKCNDNDKTTNYNRQHWRESTQSTMRVRTRSMFYTEDTKQATKNGDAGDDSVQ